MGAGGLTVERRKGTLVLTFANGPANALTPSLRGTLISALSRTDCDRFVLAGAGTTFSSALPLDPDRARPALAELCTAVESAPVPVIAALCGLVMGQGAELALAARARTAAPGTRLAFPEVALGLCPEAGTSLRLPRRIGAGPALQLLVSGRAVPTEEALALGLLDAVADDPVALAMTLALPTRNDPPPAARALAAVAAARREQAAALPAVQRIIACVEAGVLLPPEAHLAYEAVAREDLEATPEADGLAAAVRAERRAARLPPAVARQHPGPVDRIALYGARQDLVTLAQAALAQGLAVAWHHPTATDRAASLAALDLAEAAEQRSGRLTPEQRSAARMRLSDGAGSGPPPAVHIHSASPGPVRLQDSGGEAHLVLDGGREGELGLAIAPSARASELAVLAEESAEAIALAVAALRRIGLPPLLVGGRPVLGTRVVAAGDAALAHLARTGVPQRLLAEALEGFGAALPSGLPEAEQGHASIPPAKIVNRWLAALANEALRLLDQGVARRPSDVDHALVAGHGFPRWRGGPMHQADRRGLLVLRHDLRQWGRDHPVWAPAPLIDRLIQDGLRLSVLDG
jgi:3-hydroxyacyl-CoA dehydrogenase